MGAIIKFFQGVWGSLTDILTPSRAGWTGAAFGLFFAWLCLNAAFFIGIVYTDYTPYKWNGFLGLLRMQLFLGVGLTLGFAILSALAFRYRTALFFFATPFIFMLTGFWGQTGGMVLAGAVIGGLSLFFGALFTFIARGWAPWRHIMAYLSALIGFAALGASVWAFYYANAEDTNPAFAGFALEDRTLPLPDPGRTGSYDVETFSYGSGGDLHRPEYAGEASWRSRSVDGSKLVSNWSDARRGYWGFDQTALPVQGRVWAPKGEGPFPLVLIVHGNHSMEDYSDTGYGYLGEMLASRGYIFVSVDENFLNGSSADWGGAGLREENDARGWMLLEHFAQWQDWNGTAGHPFAGRVDMDRLGLIGHSRGGEAVAIAAAFNELDHYPDNAHQTFDYKYNLRAVIAIAPVDGQYRPRRMGTPMRDVNYFVIHGSHDGDVSSFMGASQWTRATFSGDDFRFKASLYVKGANHGQFNSGWGRYNSPYPFSLVLDTRDIIPLEDQERIAKVYFGAVLDIALLDKREYLPLLKDARKGAQWLPNTFYINNYQDTSDRIIASYEEDLEVSTPTLSGGRISASNLSKWQETWPVLKWRPLETHVALLAWDDRFSDETASYRVNWDDAAFVTDADTVIRFSAGQAATGTLPPGWKKDEGTSEETGGTGTGTFGPAFTMPFMNFAPTSEWHGERSALMANLQQGAGEADRTDILDWTVVAVDAQGREARLPLSHDQGLYPYVDAPVMRMQSLSDDQTSELVLRHYTFRLGDFAEANTAFDPAGLREIRFEFDRSKRGAILIDDLGLSGAGAEASEPSGTTGQAGPQDQGGQTERIFTPLQSFFCRPPCR